MFKALDRIYHRASPDATGTIMSVGYGQGNYRNDYVEVLWDVDSTKSLRTTHWYQQNELGLIPTSHSEIQQKEKPNMSQALWCDKGGHAFSAKDPDREHYTSTRNVKDGNIVNQMTVELDICGPCTKDVVLFETPKNQALPAGTIQDKIPSEG